MRRVLITMAVAASSLVTAATASANPYDLALNRLSYYSTTDSTGATTYHFNGGCGAAASGYAPCSPDNQLFVNLVNQLGGALAPGLLAPGGTIGYDELYFGVETSITAIHANASTGVNDSYWHRGLEGALTGRQGTGTGLIVERAPDTLVVPRFHVRKGFPAGFELGAQVSWLFDSNMILLGGDIRWALFEGYRHGLGYLPDFAVRGSVNTLLGNPQLYLTIVGVDAVISKSFTIAGFATLTPYVGGQALIIFGDSTVIDATPERNSYTECANRHAVFDRDSAGNVTGSRLECGGGTGQPATAPTNDSTNEMVFMPTRILRGRGFGGFRLKAGAFTLTAEFLMDAIQPQWLNGNSSVEGNGRPDPTTGVRTSPTLDPFQQWTISLGVGITL